jgi:Aspartyl protease
MQELPVSTTSFCAFLAGVSYLFISLAQGQTIPVSIPMMNIAGKKIVSVSINGSGPYNFLLDTGSNITLVDRGLLRELKLSGIEPVTLVTVLGETSQQAGMSAKSIGIGGLNLEHVALATFDRAQMVRFDKRVQGILGENFLAHFDLLIDNDGETLTLDSGSSLAASLAGERLPISRFGIANSASTEDRLIVKVKVPSYLQKPLLFLVDSGANAAVLYPGQEGAAVRAMQGSQRADLMGLDQRQTCRIRKATVELGAEKFRGIDLAACEGLTRYKMDTDGVIPTSIFHRLFISYKGGYMIANPQPVNIVAAR